MDETSKTLGEATIPAEVFVRCPMVAWKLRQTKRCDDCKYFRGLTQRLQSDQPLPFEHEFAVRCAFPVDRELFAAEIDLENERTNERSAVSNNEHS